MFRSWFVLLVACGGNPKPAVGPVEEIGIKLELQTATTVWYRAPTICGQGPYEIEVPMVGHKYGEELVVRLSTPRRISLTAIVLAGDGHELTKSAGTFDHAGKTISNGRPDNVRCVADDKERRATLGGGGGGSGGVVVPDVPTGTTIITPPPSTPIALVVDDGEPEGSIELERIYWRDGQGAQRLRLRLWSVEPNDLEFVRFGIVRFEWRPNVDESEYEAYLRRQRLRIEAKQESPEESHARWVRQNADAQRSLRDEAERDRKRARDAANDVERKRRRDAYCANHADDRGCWGAGGKRRWVELEDRARERSQYCITNTEDVRCWSDGERMRRETVWQRRVIAAVTPKLPDGPPPAPRDETPPPKLSENAEWRPGYWLWTGTTWIWLGGMWRVPDEDIAAELTTTAPVAPPPPRVEPIPPPPMPTTIWVAGFWQWNGTQYVWIEGGYQARPQAGMSWRPTEWRPRGRVHVLIPGGWIRIGGRR